ncbi:MAG: ParB/RepB/Spo0J family partition protein [Chthonomonas sp.]|nr:ParB/RepB/Spo0J family partition protein [Chthonomonas sp.]
MRRGLGKGLSHLMTDRAAVSAPKEKPKAPVAKAPKTPVAGAKETTVLPTSLIVANQRQPRTQFEEDSLKELADSIRAVGVIQPLVVRPVGTDKYELIAGERRLRASKLVGLKEVPVHIRAASAQASLEMALIENIQREDISAIECARAYEQLQREFDLTHEMIAKRVGKSRPAVANTMRLLRLPNDIQDALLDGSVSEGVVRPLLALPTAEEQLDAYERIIRFSLNARQVEALVKGMMTAKQDKVKEKRKLDPNLRALESSLSQYFGSKTSLQTSKKGGKIVVAYASDDELQRILDTMGVRL